ncbi:MULTISPECIES: class I SAM-dependent methyltransferase [unclassified Chelatococcus]|uniref:class I SAM-dependent methyltransferase n=1 Tax=unclassified Chelatococcus TaxID=2638111 RepID=UPI001BCF6FC2|nr:MULTISPECIES: class I SAM-dependent methyltransferase [unclassified Chelatococcus]MBS7696471.1 class I SAM-dependent methyltransferase [Chelatococcus sp. YT9]MBX3555037.1 class I SAM-dependent methyltransferase [Chelatococcus sp.]
MSDDKVMLLTGGPTPRTKTVLHVGCGVFNPRKLHSHFRRPGWREIRVDIDPNVAPDVEADICDLSAFSDASVDAVWSSHNLEHLYDHDVPVALREFRRVLRQTGFALMTMPDIEAIAQLVVDGKLDQVAYQSPAGPITALDMMFGHRRSVAAGNHFMSHKTAFSRDRLGNLLVDAGFARVVVAYGNSFDLWAIAMQKDAPSYLDHVFEEPAKRAPAAAAGAQQKATETEGQEGSLS